MIERQQESTWKLSDADGELVFLITVSKGDIRVNTCNIDVFGEWKMFHQALGEAIAIAEAQE